MAFVLAVGVLGLAYLTFRFKPLGIGAALDKPTNCEEVDYLGNECFYHEKTGQWR
jgi:hypothetical protein